MPVAERAGRGRQGTACVDPVTVVVLFRGSVVIKKLTVLNHMLLGKKNNTIKKAESYVLSPKSQWGSHWEVKHERAKMKINIKIWFLLYPQSGHVGEMGVCVCMCVCNYQERRLESSAENKVSQW